MSVFEKGLVTVLACDLLFVLISIPLVLRKVRPNVFYGYRTRATLSDEVVWYEANAHFGRWLVVASIVSAVAVIALYWMQGLATDLFLRVSIVAFAAPSLLAVLATARFVKALTSDRSGGSRPR